MEKCGLGFLFLEVFLIRKISGLEDVLYIIYFILFEIFEIVGIFLSVVVLDGKENKVILLLEVLE